MQITRRQFGVAMFWGAVMLFLSRFFGWIAGPFSGKSNKSTAKADAQGHPAKYWRRADHLGG